MEVTPRGILIASIIAFGLIVAANMLTQWQSNEEFRDKMKAIDPSQLLAIRVRRVAEENMELPADAEVESD